MAQQSVGKITQRLTHSTLCLGNTMPLSYLEKWTSSLFLQISRERNTVMSLSKLFLFLINIRTSEWSSSATTEPISFHFIHRQRQRTDGFPLFFCSHLAISESSLLWAQKYLFFKHSVFHIYSLKYLDGFLCSSNVFKVLRFNLQVIKILINTY